VSDSDLRQTLLGTWRLISWQVGTLKPLGDDPQGYLVYTPDDHMFVQIATRAPREWSGPEVLELSGPQLVAATGFLAYCGTFAVHDGQVLHQREFGVFPYISGTVEPRSVVALDGDRLILGGPGGGRIEWQRIHTEGKGTTNSELRQALLGTWRLVRHPLGDNPKGYLVYTADGHVYVQFEPRAERTWPGPEVLQMTMGLQTLAALGFQAYCGTFEVRDGQVIHGIEFGVLPSMSGRVEPRAVVLDGGRLILSLPGGNKLEWQRVHRGRQR
jgi:hypothetical protein